jgi:hypothetical protein
MQIGIGKSVLRFGYLLRRGPGADPHILGPRNSTERQKKTESRFEPHRTASRSFLSVSGNMLVASLQRLSCAW